MLIQQSFDLDESDWPLVQVALDLYLPHHFLDERIEFFNRFLFQLIFLYEHLGELHVLNQYFFSQQTCIPFEASLRVHEVLRLTRLALEVFANWNRLFIDQDGQHRATKKEERFVLVFLVELLLYGPSIFQTRQRQWPSQFHCRVRLILLGIAPMRVDNQILVLVMLIILLLEKLRCIELSSLGF